MFLSPCWATSGKYIPFPLPNGYCLLWISHWGKWTLYLLCDYTRTWKTSCIIISTCLFQLFRVLGNFLLKYRYIVANIVRLSPIMMDNFFWAISDWKTINWYLALKMDELIIVFGHLLVFLDENSFFHYKFTLLGRCFKSNGS